MSTRAIGPAGTAARVAGGVAFIVVPTAFDYPAGGVGWWDAVAVLLVFPLVALGGAVVVDAIYQRRGGDAVRRARSAWSAEQAWVTGIVLLLVIGVATVLTFVVPINRWAIFVFIGLSMLLAAIRGYGGCEVLVLPNLVLPNLVLRRSDAVWCPLYTPIDSAERRGDQQR